MLVNTNVDPSGTSFRRMLHKGAMPKQRTPHAIEIGRRIRALRKAAGYTQVQLAERIGIERGTLAGIEVGAASPGRSTLAALATLLGVTMDHLETGAPVAGIDGGSKSLQAEQDAHLLLIWRKMLPPQRAALLDYLERMFGSGIDNEERHANPPSVNAS